MRKPARLLITLVFMIGGLIPATAAVAAPSSNGCNGFEVARFATFKNVGDTHGHQMVHHQLERHGCVHHEHD